MWSTAVPDSLCLSAPQLRSSSAFAAAFSRQLPCILLASPSFRCFASVSCSAAESSLRNRRSFAVAAANGSAFVANFSTPPKDGVYTVGDCMTKKNDLLVVKPSTTVDEALEIIVENRISGLPVVDDDWKLVGVVSDYDLLALDSVSEEISPEYSDCVSVATKEILNRCPLATGAVIWYEQCLVRYSAENIFGIAETDHWMILLYNTANISDPERLAQFFSTNMTDMAYEAAKDSSGKKFVTREVRNLISPLQTSMIAL